jgi:hypothetical protein
VADSDVLDLRLGMDRADSLAAGLGALPGSGPHDGLVVGLVGLLAVARDGGLAADLGGLSGVARAGLAAELVGGHFGVLVALLDAVLGLVLLAVFLIGPVIAVALFDLVA